MNFSFPYPIGRVYKTGRVILGQHESAGWRTSHVLGYHHYRLTTEVDWTVMEISSQTPRFAIAVLSSMVSSPESLAINLGYLCLVQDTR